MRRAAGDGANLRGYASKITMSIGEPIIPTTAGPELGSEFSGVCYASYFMVRTITVVGIREVLTLPRRVTDGSQVAL